MWENVPGSPRVYISHSGEPGNEATKRGEMYILVSFPGFQWGLCIPSWALRVWECAYMYMYPRKKFQDPAGIWTFWILVRHCYYWATWTPKHIHEHFIACSKPNYARNKKSCLWNGIRGLSEYQALSAVLGRLLCWGGWWGYLMQSGGWPYPQSGEVTSESLCP